MQNTSIIAFSLISLLFFSAMLMMLVLRTSFIRGVNLLFNLLFGLHVRMGFITHFMRQWNSNWFSIRVHTF